MSNAQMAADAIYEAALPIFDKYSVAPEELPLVMATASNRVDAFAISAYAAECMRLRNELYENSQEE